MERRSVTQSLSLGYWRSRSRSGLTISLKISWGFLEDFSGFRQCSLSLSLSLTFFLSISLCDPSKILRDSWFRFVCFNRCWWARLAVIIVVWTELIGPCFPHWLGFFELLLQRANDEGLLSVASFSREQQHIYFLLLSLSLSLSLSHLSVPIVN